MLPAGTTTSHSVALSCDSVARSPAERGNKDSCVIKDPSVGLEASPVPRDGSDGTSTPLRQLDSTGNAKVETKRENNPGDKLEVPSCGESSSR